MTFVRRDQTQIHDGSRWHELHTMNMVYPVTEVYRNVGQLVQINTFLLLWPLFSPTLLYISHPFPFSPSTHNLARRPFVSLPLSVFLSQPSNLPTALPFPHPGRNTTAFLSLSCHSSHLAIISTRILMYQLCTSVSIL